MSPMLTGFALGLLAAGVLASIVWFVMLLAGMARGVKQAVSLLHDMGQAQVVLAKMVADTTKEMRATSSYQRRALQELMDDDGDIIELGGDDIDG